MIKQSGYPAFVDAYLDFRRCANLHPDLADFYTRRYRAFCSILKIDLAELPTEVEDASEKRALHGAFDGVARFYERISTPFAGYLEAPACLFQLAAPYETRFESLAGTQRGLCLDLLCELAAAIYGPCEHQVGEHELESHGVGLAPDADDYL